MKNKKLFKFLFCTILLLSVGCSNDEDLQIPTIPENLIPKDLAIDSIQVFDQLISGSAEADRLGLRFNFTDFQPTGVYVKPNSVLNLNIKLLQGSTLPQLLVGTYSHSTNWNKLPQSYILNEGENTIQIENGGMLYINYIDDTNPNGKVQVNFIKGWEHTPFYKINETSNANWKKMLDYFKDAPTVTLVSDKALLVVSREKAILYENENQDELLQSIDKTLLLYNNLSGMDGSLDIHKPMTHKLLMVEYKGTDYYMFAYYYRTAYSNSGVEFILNEKKFKEDGWGPWHELGHMYQMNAWTWNEVVETTVNIYSLNSEKQKGILTSRLKRENRWEEIFTYLDLVDNERSFNTNAANVWVRLGMFYQLQLAYGEDFYKKLHQSIRVENPVINNDTDRIRSFMLNACSASNKDLTDFFKKWGLKFSGVENVYNEIRDLGLSPPREDISRLSD